MSALTFENLSISAPANGVLGSGLGPPDDGITIAHDVISNVGQFGIESADSGDAGWRIENNLLERTGNSGMYLEGESFLVTGNGILDTGLDGAIPYGRHGIYLKAIKATVTYNTITGFSSTGVSVRYRDSVIEHNVIDGGQIGIAWFQYDTLPGTSYWRENCILDTSQADIWVSTAGAPGGRVLESFVITGNALGANTEHYLELAQIPGTYTVRDNRLGARTCDRDGWGVSG
ncbi:MAG TPA: right-handed parallel beta-helix repeat-containing protein [Solirubrobacteraceae bacterium]|nr:right-handed parallel beta-helix repeat-containing protein [Solirubrobacteraceae bacterium]